MRRKWCAKRWMASGLALLSLLVAAGAARAEVAVEVRIDGDAAGFSGILERDGVRVAFESRATPTGAESRIVSADGEVLTEVIVDEKAGTFDYRVGGISLSSDLSIAETEQAMKSFDRADAALAAQHLWSSLESMGYPKDSRAMAALAANLTAYEAVPKDYFPVGGDGMCMGCCGPSCWGCTGCYTSACLEHDRCVARYGYLAHRCNRILYLAALSAWCCQGAELGPLC
jgi:hypothetical protein